LEIRNYRKATLATKAIQETPEGSDHYDAGSFKTWLDRVSKTDTVAKEQIVAIYATIKARVN
jgi:hypothetical protein